MSSRISSRLLTTRYAEKIVAGEILAGQKVIKACQRHLNDLERQGADGFPWVFDEGKGHRPIRYVEKFCRPSQGNFKTLKLAPWQHFILGSIYGWVHKDTRLRRFREALIFVARKNGKTTLLSGTSLFACSKDGERGARVYHLANSIKQAREQYNECKAMVQLSPALRRHFRALRDAIYYDATLSWIEPLASDSEKLDGKNTHFAAFDEIHEYKDYKLINVIRNSTSSREQPIIFYITTAGYQLDGPLMDYYGLGADVLDGVVPGERQFYYLAELDEGDDLDNPDNWIKANPNLGVSIQLDDMVEEWERAKLIPQERSDFITKRLNRFVDSGHQAWLSWDIIKRNDRVVDWAEMRGKPCIGGFDLSDSEDFTSACLLFPLEDGAVAILTHSWIPQAKVDTDNEKIPYREYAAEGLLTIVPGEYVRKEYIYDWFVERAGEYQVEMICYDPAKAFGLVETLAAYGFTTQVVRQGYLTLGPALDDMKERFLDGNIIFNNDRLFRWYLNNVKLVEDRNRNRIPTKVGRYRKIDGFAAALTAHTEVAKRLATPEPGGGVDYISIDDLMKD